MQPAAPSLKDKIIHLPTVPSPKMGRIRQKWLTLTATRSVVDLRAVNNRSPNSANKETVLVQTPHRSSSLNSTYTPMSASSCEIFSSDIALFSPMDLDPLNMTSATVKSRRRKVVVSPGLSSTFPTSPFSPPLTARPGPMRTMSHRDAPAPHDPGPRADWLSSHSEEICPSFILAVDPDWDASSEEDATVYILPREAFVDIGSADRLPLEEIPDEFYPDGQH
ncbi:unnamed protein product [Somion occarium]|uniref:Uncharacterized protein n=1 Tax=Somion occarium TaxID=3059160 RepID=A0ABP1E8L2_9APHY